MRIAAVILAAGGSTRFGSPKQLAVLDGRSLLEWVVGAARDADLDPIVVVVPRDLEPPPGAIAVVNEDPSAGMSRSLRLGVAAVPPDAVGAVILLGDQPTVTAAHIRALVSHAAGRRPVTVTRAEGRIGPPVLLRRDAFPLVNEPTADEGLSPVLARHPELVAHLDVPRHALDVDAPGDLAALRDADPPRRGG